MTGTGNRYGKYCPLPTTLRAIFETDGYGEDELFRFSGDPLASPCLRATRAVNSPARSRMTPSSLGIQCRIGTFVSGSTLTCFGDMGATALGYSRADFLGRKLHAANKS